MYAVRGGEITTGSFECSTMPPKSKKRRQSLEAAAKGRETLKKARLDLEASGSAVPSSTTEGVTLDSASEANPGHIPVQHEEPGPSGRESDMATSEVSPLELMGEFVDSWVEALDHADKKSVNVLLCFVLVKELSFTETKAAELSAKVINKNEKTIRRWPSDLVANGGSFSETARDDTRELECCGQVKNLTRRRLSTFEPMPQQKEDQI